MGVKGQLKSSQAVREASLYVGIFKAKYNIVTQF